MTPTTHRRAALAARALLAAACALALSASAPAWAQPARAPLPAAGPAKGGEIRYEPQPAARCGQGGAPQRDADTDADAALALPDEPPISWRTWAVSGPLDDTEKTRVREFLAPFMEGNQNLTRVARCELQRFVGDELGYHLAAIVARPRPDGGVEVTIEIEPATLVRHIEVEVAGQSLLRDLARFRVTSLLDTVFEVDIQRRMRLRPGAILASNEVERDIQIKREEERIRSYLQREGYPEAVVSIAVEPDSEHSNEPRAVKLVVRIDKGSAYRIGQIEVEGSQNVSEAVIAERFRRGRYCAPEFFEHVPGLRELYGRCFLERFSQDELNQAVTKVVDIYQDRGYPAVRVRTDLDFRYSDNFDTDSKTVSFKVLVNEQRRINVLFEGNDPRQFPAPLLRPLLTFSQEGSYDDVEIAASANAIRRYYQSRGYFEAQVTYERVDLGDFERIVFTIHAGPRLSVESVAFVGNQTVDSDALAAAVRSQSGSAITAETLARDRGRIVELYRQRGYRAAEVAVSVRRGLAKPMGAAVQAALIGSDGAVLAAGGTPEASAGSAAALHIRFDIKEGPQTVIRGVKFAFVGEHRYDSEALMEILAQANSALAPGRPYVAEQVDRGRDRVGRFYFENAYPRAEVKRCVRPAEGPDLPAAAPPPATVAQPDDDGSGSEPTASPPATSPPATIPIDVVYQVRENQEVRFGQVLIHGNFKTRDWIIRDELGYKLGQPLTLGRAEEGQQNLRSSGLFNSVQVRFVNLRSGADPDVNVVVNVQERHDHWLTFEGAAVYSSDDQALLESALRFQNLFGQGLQLNARAQVQPRLETPLPFIGRSVEGTFTVPHWMTRKVTRPVLRVLTGTEINAAPRFEASAFWRRDDTPRFGDLESRGISTAVSAVGRRGFFQGWVLSLRYDFRDRSLDENLIRTPGSSDDLQSSLVGTRTGAIGPQLVIDKRRDRSGQGLPGRPDPLTPEAGFKIELRGLYADRYLGGQDTFFKVGASGQHFLSLGSRLLISNSLRYDHGFPIGATLLPETERFFAGGDTTVRGYEEDRLNTEIVEEAVPPLGEISRIRVLPAGGNIRFVYNFDVQLRVWELFDLPVASAIFFDSGLVTNSLDGAEVTDLRHALGVALLRLVAPFGSLSVEYAVPLDPRLGDNPRGRYHVNFGLLF